MAGTLAAAAHSPLSLSRYSFTPTITAATFRASVQNSLADFDSRKSACPYKILRIKPSASPIEIKSAYRRLAKRFHPDSSPESGGQRFIEIHDAYATLSDLAARSVYDSSLLELEVRRRRRRTMFGDAVGRRSGFYPTRKWETDQCW